MPITITKRSLLIIGAAGIAAGMLGRRYVLPAPTPDGTVTDQFKKIARAAPVLDTLRRSVGRTLITYQDGSSKQGSSVLVDRQGTLAMSEHQSGNDTLMTVQFLPRGAEKLDYQNVIARFVARDKDTDTSFWRLEDPGAIERLGLQPVTWERLVDMNGHNGALLLLAGFPGDRAGLLHAEVHRITGYTAKAPVMVLELVEKGQVKPVEKNYNCKIRTNKETTQGMSGGGVFDADNGKFLGLIFATGENETEFTPADAVWNGYVRLAPGIKGTNYKAIQDIPRECDIGRPASSSAGSGTPVSRSLSAEDLQRLLKTSP